MTSRGRNGHIEIHPQIVSRQAPAEMQAQKLTRKPGHNPHPSGHGGPNFPPSQKPVFHAVSAASAGPSHKEKPAAKIPEADTPQAVLRDARAQLTALRKALLQFWHAARELGRTPGALVRAMRHS